MINSKSVPKKLNHLKSLGFKFPNLGNAGSSKNIDWNVYNRQRITVNSDLVLTFTNPKHDSKDLFLLLTNDSTGFYSITFPSNIIWENGVDPFLTEQPNERNLVCLKWVKEINTYFGKVFPETSEEAFPFVSGRYYDGSSFTKMFSRAVGSSSLPSNNSNANCSPFYAGKKMVVDKIGMDVTGSSSGSTGRIFLAKNVPGDFKPGKLIWTSDPFSTATTGDKEFDVNLTLQGWYWACYSNSSSSVSVRSYDDTTSADRSIPYGYASLDESNSGNENKVLINYSHGSPGDENEPPDDLSDLFNVYFDSDAPAIRFRAA